MLASRPAGAACGASLRLKAGRGGAGPGEEAVSAQAGRGGVECADAAARDAEKVIRERTERPGAAAGA